jgi:hypothetical protein
MAATCSDAAEKAFEYNAHGKRDPFVPLVGVAREGSAGGAWGVFSIDDVVLQGITLGPGGERCVIINGEIMKEGDKIGLLSVQSIGNNEVILRIEDKTFEKKLYEEQ